MILLQNELREQVGDWGVLVACILLNQSVYATAQPVSQKLFKWYDSPRKMSQANPRMLVGILRPVGLQNIRSERLIGMSEDYLTWKNKYAYDADASILTGCGEFARDAWRLCVLKNTGHEPEDNVLKEYWKELKREESSSS